MSKTNFSSTQVPEQSEELNNEINKFLYKHPYEVIRLRNPEDAREVTYLPTALLKHLSISEIQELHKTIREEARSQGGVMFKKGASSHSPLEPKTTDWVKNCPSELYNKLKSVVEEHNKALDILSSKDNYVQPEKQDLTDFGSDNIDTQSDRKLLGNEESSIENN